MLVIQSATLYRVSKKTSTFQSSFMGLEFVLYKGQHQGNPDLAAEVFNPAKALDMEHLNDEDALAFYESREIIYYLDSKTVSKINAFLKTLSVDQAIASYDSEELNRNGVYPEKWKAGHSREEAFIGYYRYYIS
jgi:hypothetical protein